MSKQNPLQQFTFDHNGMLAQVRVHQDEQGEPWFAANDICAILDIADAKQAIARLDNDERGGYSIPTPGGMQQMNCINESGLYSLIFTSRKEGAKAFKKWVTSEVLPSIRKQGYYQLKGMAAPTKQIIDLQKQAVSLLSKLEKATDPATRNFLYGMLQSVAVLIDQPAPPLLAIGKAVDPNAEPELATQFFSHLEKLAQLGEQLNHSADPTLLAINLNEYTSACQRHGLPEQHKATLLKDLKASKRLRDASLAVRSVITHKPVKCWVFVGGAV